MFIVEVWTWSKTSVYLSSVMLMNVGKSRNLDKKVSLVKSIINASSSYGDHLNAEFQRHFDENPDVVI